MPAPADLVAQLTEAIAQAITPVLNEAWDRSELETRKRIAASVMQFTAPRSATEAAAQTVMRLTSGKPNSALETAIERVNATVLSQPMSPQKRGAQNRVAKGRVKIAVWNCISRYPDEGLSRDEIRHHAAGLLGEPIKEGSLKQAIRLLKKDRKIETRNSRWWPLV